jgi:deoxyribonuclease IV
MPADALAGHRLLLGAHMSIAGGVHTAFERGVGIGCTAMQVFTKNSNQWAAKPLSAQDIQHFRAAEAKAKIFPVVAHAAYLINLCARNPSTLKKSRKAFEDELRRCEMLGIHALIFHPGSHIGAGEEQGIKLIAESINIAHRKTHGFHVLSALETTAGQGTALAYRFEQLKQIIDLVDERNRMAVCLDTCHLFAAGYDISTLQGWEETIAKFDEIIGVDRLVAVHVNDSKNWLGSRVDRHEHIGKGTIGLVAFRMLMSDARLRNVPKILETEKSDDMHEDIENMDTLRSLMRDA